MGCGQAAKIVVGKLQKMLWASCKNFSLDSSGKFVLDFDNIGNQPLKKGHVMTFSNSDDTIDSRDVIERISELEDELECCVVDEENATVASEDGETDLTDEYEELQVLKALAGEAEGYADDWSHGVVLIKESYFTEYAQQLAEDIGAIDTDSLRWPACHIDWNAAADALKIDYTEVNFDGTTFLSR